MGPGPSSRNKGKFRVRVAPTGRRRSLRAIVASMAIAFVFYSTLGIAATVEYVYDALGRLIAVIEATGQTTRYTYDAAGNLISVTRDSSTAFRVDGFSPATTTSPVTSRGSRTASPASS